MDNITFLFPERTIKSRCPEGQGHSEAISARVFCVEFRQEVAGWQRWAGAGAEPARKAKQQAGDSSALNGVTEQPNSANHCLDLCVCGEHIEAPLGQADSCDFSLICRTRNVADPTKTTHTAVCPARLCRLNEMS